MISGATLLVAVGCGGGSSSSGSPSGGSGGSSGDTGGNSSGATGGTSSKGGSGGKGGSTGKAGSSSTGGQAGEAGALGEGGEAGATNLPPSKFHAISSPVTVGFKSSSPNYTLITTIGDGLGGTAVGGVSKRASSAKHIYIPGVVAAETH